MELECFWNSVSLVSFFFYAHLLISFHESTLQNIAPYTCPLHPPSVRITALEIMSQSIRHWIEILGEENLIGPFLVQRATPENVAIEYACQGSHMCMIGRGVGGGGID